MSKMFSKYAFRTSSLFLKESSLSSLVGKSNFSQTKQVSNAKIRGLENEPNGPIVNTPVPGPKSKELSSELSKIQAIIFKLN